MAKFKFQVTIEVDQDQVPGMGHTPESWIGYIFNQLLRNDCYHPSVTVNSAYLGEYKCRLVCDDWNMDGIKVDKDYRF